MAKSNDDAMLGSDPLDRLRAIINENGRRALNEADTRHRIIDLILHDLLAWPRNRVSVEEYVAPGFVDYVLKKANDDPLILIEAKKEGLFFELPHPPNEDETSSYIGIGKLLTDQNIKSAMTQVRTYCLDTGCEFACVTNGHEWIFFKIFERTKRWEALQAFIVRNLTFFELEHTRAYNLFSYRSITERISLPSLLTSTPPLDRSIFYAKDQSRHTPMPSLQIDWRPQYGLL